LIHLIKQNIDLENHHNHPPTSPLPIILSGATAFWERRRRREGRGDRSTTTPINHHHLGEVHPQFQLAYIPEIKTLIFLTPAFSRLRISFSIDPS